MQISRILMIGIIVLMNVGAAYGGTPPGNLCLSNPDPDLCGFTTNPFGAIMDVFDQLIPGFGLLLLWGPIVFALWYKTQQPLIAAMFGIIISVSVTTIHPTAIYMGLTLAAISAGLALIGIFQRVKQTV